MQQLYNVYCSHHIAKAGVLLNVTFTLPSVWGCNYNWFTTFFVMETDALAWKGEQNCIFVELSRALNSREILDLRERVTTSWALPHEQHALLGVLLRCGS